MAVPNTFASATSSIPLANLDANFAYYDAGFSLSGSAVTFAGSITLTTGTANGVPYLNASKVLTSGAVLTFDGTTLSSTKFAGALNGTVGATTPTTGAFTTVTTSGLAAFGGALSAYAVQVTTTGNNGISVNNGTNQIFLGSTGGAASVGTLTAHDFQVIRNGATISNFTATGLAVTGTLSATGSGTLTNLLLTAGTLPGAGNPSIALRSSDNTVYLQSGSANSTVLSDSAQNAMYIASATSHIWNISNVEKARIDSSGNLGLGVTPSAWSSASRPALQLTNGAALFSRTGSTFLGQNFFYNASDAGTYIANGFATVYNQASGQHQWYNAPSGTAGNAAALTQAMTLDASGNLGIGTSSPAVRLQSNIATSGLPVTSGTTQTNGALRLSSAATSGILDFGLNGSSPWIQATDYTDLSQTYNISLNPNGGNVGIGTSSPGSSLQVGVGTPRETTASFFGTGSQVASSISTVGIYSTNTAAVGVGAALTLGGQTGNGVATYPFGIIQGAKNNATAGDYGGYLQFNTIPSNGGSPIPNLTLTTGGGVQAVASISVGNATPTLSGAGITFPATQSASTDANTLDDYEESTWTPTLAFGGNSVGITYTSGYNTSSVTKIGSRVFVSGITILTSKGSSTGNASLKSLPFPPSGSAGFSAVACSLSNTTFTGQYALEVDANDAVVYFYQVSALGAQSNLTNTNFANNSSFSFSFSYYTSA